MAAADIGATGASSPAPHIVFHGRTSDGHSTEVQGDARHVVASKRAALHAVRFAQHDGEVATMEGSVRVAAGDALVTGAWGEEWPVPRERFARKYAPVAPTAPGEPGSYMSLPCTVLAIPMQSPFQVVMADAAGSRLQGRAGDWLVDYGDGSLGVVRAALFETLYRIESRDDGDDTGPRSDRPA